jgi:hypothetical protein
LQRVRTAFGLAVKFFKLIVGRIGDPQKFPAKVGWGETLGMALKQLSTKRSFKRVDVPVDGCTVNAEGVCCRTHRSKAGDTGCCSDFRPMFHADMSHFRALGVKLDHFKTKLLHIKSGSTR